jgi:hypothetical protein
MYLTPVNNNYKQATPEQTIRPFSEITNADIESLESKISVLNRQIS